MLSPRACSVLGPSGIHCERTEWLLTLSIACEGLPLRMTGGGGVGQAQVRAPGAAAGQPADRAGGDHRAHAGGGGVAGTPRRADPAEAGGAHPALRFRAGRPGVCNRCRFRV